MKILLTSNIKIGHKSHNPAVPDDIRVSTLEKICGIARSHDILLIAGNLLNSSVIDRSLFERVKELFRDLRENKTDIILSPGSCEVNEGRSISSSLFGLNLSHIFSSRDYKEPYPYVSGGQKLYIHGMPPSDITAITGISPGKRGGFHIGLFYNEHVSDESILKSLPLDLYVFGAEKEYKTGVSENVLKIVSPGAPESLYPGDTGDKYAVSLVIEDDRVVSYSKKEVNSITYISGLTEYRTGTVPDYGPEFIPVEDIDGLFSRGPDEGRILPVLGFHLLERLESGEGPQNFNEDFFIELINVFYKYGVEKSGEWVCSSQS